MINPDPLGALWAGSQTTRTIPAAACSNPEKSDVAGLMLSNRKVLRSQGAALGVQVFLDVVESVNLLVNSNGTVVRSEVVGALKMRTFLSGMPECKLGLNDKVPSRILTQKGSFLDCYCHFQRQGVS